MESQEVMVHKVTLSTGKVVLLRDLQIKDQDMAANAAGRNVNSENKVALALAMQKELLKMLIVKINDEATKKAMLENLDSVFTYGEYMQLVSVLEKLTGGEAEMGNFQMELVTSGGI